MCYEVILFYILFIMWTAKELKTTRRKERIRPFLSVLQKYREENPDMRFIQLLWSLGMIDDENDGFNKEEKDLYKNSTIPVRDWITITKWEWARPSYIILKHAKNSDINNILFKHNEWNTIDDFLYRALCDELILREELQLYI